MQRRTAVIAGMALFFLGSRNTAAAQASARDEMQFAQFLIGTWSCAHTVGDFAGTYTTTVVPALDNRWLRQTYDFPEMGGRSGAVHAEYFIGFDPRNQKWLRFGAMSDGMYFGMVGTRSDNTLTFGYVLPGTKGSATYTKVSDTEFKVDGPSYPENGTTVTEHHTCRKVT